MKGKFLSVTLLLCLFMTVAISQAAPTIPEKMFLHEVYEGPKDDMYVKSLLHGTLVFKEIVSDSLFLVEIDMSEIMRVYEDEDGECGDFLAIFKTKFHYVGTIEGEPYFDPNWIEHLDILDTGVLVADRVITAVTMGQVENIHWVILWEAGVPNPVVEVGQPFTYP